MPKFGRGLNRELVAAVNRCEIEEPLTTRDVALFAERRGWKVRPSHLQVTLQNASNEAHSPTYKKYFLAVGRGRFRLRDEYRGTEWL